MLPLCVVSVLEARRIVKQTAEYLVWIDERQAKHFREPGWVELKPHRDGGVLFLNRERERRALLPPVNALPIEPEAHSAR